MGNPKYSHILDWLGHVYMTNLDVLKNFLMGRKNKKRPLGKPRTRWKDTAEKCTRLVNGNATMEWIREKQWTLDREKWRGLLEAAQVHNGPLSC